jgi:hypothetical protein
MNQNTFDGWTAHETGWEEYSERIRPNVTAPSTCGLNIMSIFLGGFAYPRWRTRRTASAQS